MPSVDVMESNICLDFSLLDLSEKKCKHSSDVAQHAVKAIENLVSHSSWETANELLEILKEKGKLLMESHPNQVVIGNMVKRVMKIIRDEYSGALGTKVCSEVHESIEKMLAAKEQVDYKTPKSSLKESILESLRELLTEIETTSENIAAQSLEHIHSDDVVMTAGKSRTVENFLKKASLKRKFQVIVVEGAPFYHGHELAKNLSEAGIKTTLIHDCAIFALITRVNKVIIGTHSVMANGGLKAACGMHSLALAAKHRLVPFIVCAPLFKLTPQYLHSTDQEGFNHFKSSCDVFPYEERIVSDVEVLNPAFDYVPPELVTLLVTNNGGNPPSYVRGLLSEVYNVEDHDM